MNPIQIINLLNVPRIGPRRVKKILTHLNQDQNPFETSIKDLRTIKGIDAKPQNSSDLTETRILEPAN